MKRSGLTMAANHSDTWLQLLAGIGPPPANLKRYEHPLAMKLLASVGSIRPEPFVRVDEHAPRSMPGSVTAVGVGLTNDFMSALGRDLWRRQYAMEREAFEPWIDFGGES